ncbi:MAG: metal-dependent transcriptional regulator [Deltaproteobacteria bacterium]|nr:metal-dependent transcriptional regulator [Deltaproteobacteria bacterium]MBN2674660.1 metal-dependent transcriptional regulator [Deltaproteobacteria bacterium]
MPEITKKPEISRSLEDYLAAIWQVIQEKRFARVKDIAALRDVKPGSVSPAMAKLARLGLIVYERREFILLTPLGAEIAGDLIRRQRLLKEFFKDILKLPATESTEQACAVEHCLTEEATARLEDLILFIRSRSDKEIFEPASSTQREFTIASMSPGQEATVRLIHAQGDLHHQLIDMGLLPDSKIKLVSQTDAAPASYLIALQGFEISLSAEQAAAVVVSIQ